MLVWTRRLHLWCGALFAPGILLFAVSGLLQVFHLHKAQPDTGYQPPALVRALGDLHKTQALRPPREASTGRDRRRPDHKADRAAPSAPAGVSPLQWYAAAMSVSLIATTLAGLYMALRNRRDRPLALALLALGVAAPAVLLALQV